MHKCHLWDGDLTTIYCNYSKDLNAYSYSCGFPMEMHEERHNLHISAIVTIRGSRVFLDVEPEERLGCDVTLCIIHGFSPYSKRDIIVAIFDYQIMVNNFVSFHLMIAGNVKSVAQASFGGIHVNK